MSEQLPAPEFSEDLAESTNDEGKTVPTEEILNALQQLNASQQADKKEPQEQPQDPPSEWDLLRNQLTEQPHDPDGWRKLVEMAENSGDIDKITDAYEALLAIYPNTVWDQPLWRFLSDILTTFSLPRRSRI
jgi:cleavage stimulation factor subunit 3